MAVETNDKFVKVPQLVIVKDYIDEQDAKGFKTISVDNSTGKINFFKTEDGSGSPAYTITVADLIKDKYLDGTKTTVVNKFAWSDATYPGSANPNLDDKPVVVFAVANGDETIYSFASLEALIDVYTGVDGETAKVTVSDDNKITVDVKISEKENNAITQDNGLFVDISNKADKVADESRKADQILVDDGNGNPKGSSKTIAEMFAEYTATDEEFKEALGIT